MDETLMLDPGVAQATEESGGMSAGGRTLPSDAGDGSFDGFPTMAQERAADQQDTWDGLVLLTVVLSVLWLGVSVCYGLLWMVAKAQGWW